MALAHEEKDFATIWRDKIEEWLQEEGWQVGHRIVSEWKWVLTVRDSQGRPLAIGHPATSKDQIVIEIGVALDLAVQEKIGQLAAADRRNLIYDLHEGLILIGVQYMNLGEPLREFILESVCYFDGLTKNELLSRIRRVRDGGILTQHKIARALNQPPPPPPPQPRIGFPLPTR